LILVGRIFLSPPPQPHQMQMQNAAKENKSKDVGYLAILAIITKSRNMLNPPPSHSIPPQNSSLAMLPYCRLFG
jgi:hypothetical protein